MDLLNDDNSLVRLQTLDAMFHMVSYDQLKVEEAHMHMVGLSVFLTYYGAYWWLQRSRFGFVDLFFIHNFIHLIIKHVCQMAL